MRKRQTGREHRLDAAGQMLERPIHGVVGIRRAGERAVRSRWKAGASAGARRHAVSPADATRHRHAVFGQCAGLVGAEHGRRAQRLDGRGAARENARLRHTPGAHHHEDREHQRKFFRQHDMPSAMPASSAFSHDPRSSP